MILLAIIILWILFKLWLNGSDVSKDNNKNKNNLKDDYIKKIYMIHLVLKKKN